jgi:hypothetical protein
MSPASSTTFQLAGVPVKLDVSHGADKEVGLAFARNDPFPDRDIKLGSLNVSAPEAAGAIALGDNLGKVSFKINGSAASTLGVYLKPDSLKKDIDPDQVLKEIDLPKDAARFVAFRAMYDINGAAKGAMALAPGASATLDVKAGSDGFYAVIRAFAEDPGARDAVTSLVRSWKLPRLVNEIGDLAPGTWLVAEVNGEFAAKLGAQFGYDYTWLRNVNAAGLTGDLKLRIQAAVKATLGFSASGRYFLTVARESLDPAAARLRVRLAKGSARGWSFAFSAAATLTPDTRDLTPAKLEDFIAAVFGVHGSQLFKDIKDWIDPAHPLHEKLSGFAAHHAREFLGDQTKAVEAMARIKEASEKWEALPHTATSWLWNRLNIGEKGFTATLKKSLEDLVNLDAKGAAALLQKWIGQPAFLDTPAGSFVSAALEDRLLTALLNRSEVEGLKAQAQSLLDILNGSVVESLIKYYQQKLRISDELIDEIGQAASLETFEPWLAQKLSAFLGKRGEIKHLEEVRKTLHTLLGKAEEFYQAAIETLNQDWKFALDAAYTKTTSRSALLDVEFDFAANPAARDLMKAAIRGDFESLLLAAGPAPGVTVRTAELTHGIKRTSTVQVTLPYFKSRIEAINTSLAKMKFVSDGGGVVYTLDAKDDVVARDRWRSTLSLTGRFHMETPAAGINSFAKPGDFDNLAYNYRLRLAGDNFTTTQLQRTLEPLVSEYLPKNFTNGKGSLAEWVAHLDAFTNEQETDPSFLGRVALELTVALSGKVVAAWTKAPTKNKGAGQYALMSAHIQKTLRRLVPLCYFDSTSKYKDIKVARALLTYASLPVIARKTDFYFDYLDEAKREAFVSGPQVHLNLAPQLARVNEILSASKEHKGSAQFFLPQDTGPCIKDALDTIWLQDSGLLRAEAEIIAGSVNAGNAFAEFREKANKDFEAALEALAEFGAEITMAINRKLPSLFGPRTLRAMGTAVFIEAATAFDESIRDARPAARLLTTLVRNTAPKDEWKNTFLEKGELEPAQVLTRVPIVTDL